MRYLLILAALASVSGSLAQPYAIGSRSITFHDDARNRDIPTNLYYPAAAAGSNVPVEVGSYPVLVVGHGFVMATSAYANLWNHFVPKGYIVALPNTEGGFTPSHGDFGQDLAFVAQAMQAANVDVASPFYTHVLPSTALMGHSMGGGASLLGAASNTSIQTVVDLAPAETNPSAVAAAAGILVPTLIFAGSNDCITPIADHTGPMYTALTVPCRAFVNISGGGHCYFAESNFNCTFGELTCTPTPAITRMQQHEVVNDFAGLWLDHFLKGDEQAFADVLDSMALTTRAVCTTTCALTTGLDETSASDWQLFPVPAMDRLVISGQPSGATIGVVDISGREVMAPRTLTSGQSLDLRLLPAGTYRAVLRAIDRLETRAFIVLR